MERLRFEECNGCQDWNGCISHCMNICGKPIDALEKFNEYMGLKEQGRLLIVPEIPKNKTLYWIWANEIMPVIFKRITSCKVDDNGKPHITCEMVTKKDRTFTYTYRRKPVENIVRAGDKRYFYSEEIGKTIFFTRKEAEEALQKMNEAD